MKGGVVVPNKLFDEIEAKKHRLDSMRPLTAGEVARLNEEFIVEYTYNSNAIEGNTLTLQETDWVLKGLTVAQKPLKDHLEVVGHKEAFDFISKMVKSKEPLSESLIKQIHFLVLADKPEDRGVYRRIPVRIIGAQHEPVQPYLIGPRMEQLLYEYGESQEPLITKLARFHIEFERIHPFIDGNGRMGRLWQTLILMQQYPVFEFLPIESLIKQNQQEYYNKLSESDKKGNSTPFIEFMLGIILETLEQLLQTQSKILHPKDRISLFKEKIHNNKFSRKDYMQSFKNISAPTASRDLKWAVEQKILSKFGEQRLTEYQFNY